MKKYSIENYVRYKHDLAQALRSIGEPIFGQTVKDISGGKLLKQLFYIIRTQEN